LVLLHNTEAFTGSPVSFLSSYGWMGVDLFFVLSGFLITGILLDADPHESYFKNFYARRCLRIWPLYFAVLFLMFGLMPLIRPVEAHIILERSSPRWAYPFFLQNFLVRVPTLASGPLGVTWSLAVEELFYVFWPFFVRYLSPARLKHIAVLVILFSPLLRLFLATQYVYIYSNPFCRLDGLMAGALLALLIRTETFSTARYLNLAWAALFLSAPLAYFSEVLHTTWLTYSMSALGSAAVIYLALFSPKAWLQSALRNRFLAFTGVISYGLYLLHKIPYDLLKAAHYDKHPFFSFLITLVTGYLLAYASWNLLEKPFLKLKRFFGGEIRKDQTTPVRVLPSPDVQLT
jgi:peptidoglycan/LPS O-acetylase OafA/YrhL